MTILYVSTFYPSKTELFRGHYIEKQAIHLSKELNENFIVLKPVLKKNISKLKIESEIVNGNKVLKLYIPNLFGLYSIYPFFYFLQKKITKLLRDELVSLEIKLVVSNDLFYSLLLGNLISKTSPCKHINIIHGESISDKTVQYIKNKIKEQLLLCNEIFAVSSKTKYSIQKLLKLSQDIKVNGNGIDEEIIEKYKNFTFNKKDKLTIVSIGNLNFNKGFDITITALANLNKDFEFLIIGDGLYKGELQKLVNNYNLTSKVKFLGNISNEKVFTILEKSHFFILPSRNEAFGIVYLEGMITNNICVGTKGQGCEDFISNGENGYLVKSSEEITRIISNYEQISESNLISNGHRTALKYTWDENVKNLVKYL
ncbi:glycosyltransferase [Aerococcus urinaeequi]|uniref:glycosyltransferase n=1 Tax=Aerococcus urinaeequi TaxID=51665 RepID=UPI003D6BD5D8